MKPLALLLGICLILINAAQAQDSLKIANEAAEFDQIALKGLRADKASYFNAFKPSLSDCRAVFKGAGAELVFAECKSGLNPLDPQLQIPYQDLKTNHYTTTELKMQPEFLASNKREMREHILPNLRFYQIIYLESEEQLAMRYFVKVDDHWVFFASPWKAFVTQD